MNMTERDANRLQHWVERAQYDLAQVQEILRTYACADADTDTRTRTRPSADAQPRVVNKQNSNNTPIVKNKQTKTCVCVTDDDTENTHTQFLSLDFVQSHLPKDVPAWYAAFWYEKMEQRNWRLKDGNRVTAANWQYFLGTFFGHATDAELAAAQNAAKAQPLSQVDAEEIQRLRREEYERLWGKRES